VARVKYGNWTDGHHLRQPRFGGLLEDHDPLECTFEKELEGEVHVETSKISESKKKPAKPLEHGKVVASIAAARPAGAKLSSNRAISEKELGVELESGSREEVFATIAGNEVHLTHLNKVYFPEDGYTKRNLLHHYLKMAPLILPFLKDRPLVLRRYPNGIHEEPFFQKDAGKGIPEWIQTAAVQSETRGRTIGYFLANDLSSLLYMTNLGCIDHNPWSSRYQTEDYPDYIFFDLDPGPNVGFQAVVALANALIQELENLHMKIFVKTSGATGLHIFLPIEPVYTYEQVRQFVQVVAVLVAQKLPKLVTTERSLNRRPKGTIYVDAHQNSRGQSLASVYSVRAFPHAPVSTPLLPRELNAKLTPETWNIKSIRNRVEKVGDLWGDFWKHPNNIEKAIEGLEKMLR
jgi:bifunctional non-homologous end joining protein LigD